MGKEIDARGLACPAPVLKTKEAIEREDLKIIRVLVDNEAAKENVSRFLKSKDFEVDVEKREEEFFIIGKKIGEAPDKGTHMELRDRGEQKIMVMVATDSMGHGDDELGAKLMINFLKTLKEMGNDLWRLVFVNNGVKLTISGSEALDVLKELEEAGVHILVCGTCLGHFNLLDQKKVGETTNMLDIVTSMQLADKVINI